MNDQQREKIYLTGKVFIGYRKKAGWKKPLAFYAFECPFHGYVEDFPHGHNGMLECPRCLQEYSEMFNAVDDEAIITEIYQTPRTNGLAPTINT